MCNNYNTTTISNQFSKLYTLIHIHTWSDKAFKGTVVNRALPSLSGVSLEITLTIPLRKLKIVILIVCSPIYNDALGLSGYMQAHIL